MYGIIDIGSNTMRFNIYKVHNMNFHLILSSKERAGLASYKNDGRMSMEGVQKASNILYRFNKISTELGLNWTKAFATAPLRGIDNAQEAKLSMEKLSGMKIKILSGEEEGTLGYQGANFQVSIPSGVNIDIGGGSTEVVNFENNIELGSVSLPLGSLSMFLDHVCGIIPVEEELKALYESSKEQIKKDLNLDIKPGQPVVGVGGTIRAALRLNNFINDLPDTNKTITVEQLKQILHFLKGEYELRRRAILRTCPDRVHTVVPGMIILLTLLEEYSLGDISVSDFGVREGYLTKLLMHEEKGGQD